MNTKKIRLFLEKETGRKNLKVLGYNLSKYIDYAYFENEQWQLASYEINGILTL